MSSLDSELFSAHAAAAPRRDAFYWRFCVLTASFLVFGLGALVVGLLLLPAVRVWPAARAVRRSRARAVMRVSLRFFVGFMHRLRGLDYEFRGVERLGRPGQLIVANHPTLIDVVFLLAFTRGANCVVKQGLWRNPFTRGAVTLAEYITNDPTAAMIDASAEALHAGETLIMFPEGTRTTPGKPYAFHRGAANVALRAARVLTPVYIRCEPEILSKEEPWHRLTSQRVRFTLVVGEDVDLSPYRGRPLPLASRRLNDDLLARFEEELPRRLQQNPDAKG
jgi:1-acyl-sn-glycerol-3-phosphate acyltransferase